MCDSIPTTLGKHSQSDAPSTPAGEHHDTKQDMQTRGHMTHKVPGNCLLGCVFSSTETGSVCHFFLRKFNVVFCCT